MKRFFILIFALLAFQAGFAMDNFFDDLELDNNALSHQQNPAKKARLLNQDDDDFFNEQEGIEPWFMALPQTSPIANTNSNNTPITNAAHDPSHNPDFRAAQDHELELGCLHQQNHTPNNPSHFECSVGLCRESFTTQDELNDHRFKEHNIQDNRQLSSQEEELPNNQLPQNINHAGNRGKSAAKCLPCPYEGCSKIYRAESALKVHLNVEHSQDRQYSCHFCKKIGKNMAFSKDVCFLRHLASHTTPYACNMGNCSETFARKSYLMNHQEKKHGVTPNQKITRDRSTRTWPCFACGLFNNTDRSAHKEQCAALVQKALQRMNIETNDQRKFSLLSAPVKWHTWDNPSRKQQSPTHNKQESPSIDIRQDTPPLTPHMHPHATITNAANDPSHNTANTHAFVGATTDTQPASKTYACKYPGCVKSYSFMPGLSRHINDEHTHTRHDSCHFCAEFPTNTESSAHSTIYFNRAKFLAHLKTHTRPYQCNVQGCTERFAEAVTLAKHQTNKHRITNNAKQERDRLIQTSPCLMCGLQNIADLSAHKEQCKSLLKDALRKLGVEDSDQNLEKIGFSENKYMTAAFKYIPYRPAQNPEKNTKK